VGLTLREAGPSVVTAGVLATSAVAGVAGHWFAAWLLVAAGCVICAVWSSRTNDGRRRAIQDARAELEHVRDLQRSLRAELDGARREARANQQEARADLELLRAEVVVATSPDDPEDRPPR
jgi:thiosulfate reductase cytochrome b subunit